MLTAPVFGAGTELTSYYYYKIQPSFKESLDCELYCFFLSFVDHSPIILRALFSIIPSRFIPRPKSDQPTVVSARVDVSQMDDESGELLILLPSGDQRSLHPVLAGRLEGEEAGVGHDILVEPPTI